jgi:hypothetical protein
MRRLAECERTNCFTADSHRRHIFSCWRTGVWNGIITRPLNTRAVKAGASYVKLHSPFESPSRALRRVLAGLHSGQHAHRYPTRVFRGCTRYVIAVPLGEMRLSILIIL